MDNKYNNGYPGNGYPDDTRLYTPTGSPTDNSFAPHYNGGQPYQPQQNFAPGNYPPPPPMYGQHGGYPQYPGQPDMPQYGAMPQNPDNYCSPYPEEEQERSFMPLLTGIIIALIIAVCGLSVYLIIRNSNDDKSNVLPAAATEMETDATTVPATGADEQEFNTEVSSSTAANSTETVTTTAPPAPLREFPPSDISNYPQYTELIERDYKNGVLGSMMEQSPDCGYCLTDLNGDGSPELLLLSGDSYILSISAIISQKAVMLKSVNGGYRDWINIYHDGYILHAGSDGAAIGGGTFYKYDRGSYLTMVSDYTYEYLTSEFTSTTAVVYKYTENGSSRQITQDEYEKLFSVHGEPVKFNKTPLSSVPSLSLETKPAETYAFYGYVATETDALNLRKEPSSTAEVLKQLPKDSKGSIYYVEGNPEWYKMYPDSGGEGYVSAKYIKEVRNSQSSGTKTPWGNFTYTNFSENYNITIYDPKALNVSVRFDFSEYNLKNKDSYRIDNVYCKITKNKNSPAHEYQFSFVIAGTVLNDKRVSERIFYNPTSAKINNNDGSESFFFTGVPKMTANNTNLYKGDTFCYDASSWVNITITDNSSYTVILD